MSVNKRRFDSTQSTIKDNILIVTVTKVETTAILKAFLGDDSRQWNRSVIGNKTYYDLGMHSNVPVFMMQSEMGTATPGGALLTVRQAIQDLQPQAIIMCGIAFGLHPDKQQLGNILIAKQLLNYEPLKLDFDRGQFPRGDRVTASERLLDRFRSGDIYWQGAPIQFGLILSGEKLVNEPGFRDWLLKFEPEALGGEMEGAGLYVAARDAKVDWILVKAICDWADGNKSDEFQSLAATNAAQFVQHVLQVGDWELSDSKKVDLPTSFRTPDSVMQVIRKEIEAKEKELPNMRPGVDLGNKVGDLFEIGYSKGGPKAIAQLYENATIVWHLSGKYSNQTFITYGDINCRYRKLGEKPWKLLGLPISDEGEAKWSPYINCTGEQNRGRYSLFEEGEIVWWGYGEYKHQAIVIKRPISTTYDFIGGSGSYLGFPLSDTYEVDECIRTDFEGGSIVSFDDREAHIVLQLLQTNYSDSPFNHDWKQYAGSEDLECAGIRLDTRIGYSRSFIAFNTPGSFPGPLNSTENNKAIMYPAEGFVSPNYYKRYGGLAQRYCGITVKALMPNDWMVVYIRIKTNSGQNQYLQYDSFTKNRIKEADKDGVNYWKTPIPYRFLDGDFHTLVIDLHQTTLNGFEMGFEELRSFHFRGRIGIADLMVSDSREAIEAVAINPIFVE